MRRFVVYEVWTRSKVVTARLHEPGAPPAPGLTLCNWHAVEAGSDADDVLDRIHRMAAGGGEGGVESSASLLARVEGLVMLHRRGRA